MAWEHGQLWSIIDVGGSRALRGGWSGSMRFLYACSLIARFVTAAWLPYFDDGESKVVPLECPATRTANYMVLVLQ